MQLPARTVVFSLLLLSIVTQLSGQAGSNGLVSKALAASKKFDRTKYEINCKRFTLENGLILLVNEDHSAPVVSVNMWYHVGSRNELVGKTGFAHLFEHFFFNGSDNYPHGFREAMDAVGANNRNGTTNVDRTNFFEDVPVSALDRTLYLEADRMGFLTLSKEMLERERGVVKNEKRESDNEPYGKGYGEMFSKLYPASHPYSWSVIGSMEDLNAATIDDIHNWYKQYYGPNNAVICLSGDITPDAGLAMVKKYFGGIEPVPPIARIESWTPVLGHNLHQVMEDRVSQSLVWRVYHLPAWKEKELEHVRLFSNILTGAINTRLEKKLGLEKKLTDFIYSFIEEHELGSLFHIQAFVTPGTDPGVVEKEMDKVIEELITKGPTAGELTGAKNRHLGNFSRSIERSGGQGGRSDLLAESMTFGGNEQAYLDRLEWMVNATIPDVMNASKKWILAPHYTLVINPYPSMSTVDSKVDRSRLPTLSAAPDVKFPKVERGTLKNGLKVLLLERSNVPIVNLTLFSDAGYSSDPAGKEGIAILASGLMSKGTASKDVYQIANELDNLGAKLTSESTLDLTSIKLETLAENLTPSLRIFADVILHPAFREDITSQEKLTMISAITYEKSSPASMIQRVLPGLLFGASHPYGKPVLGQEKTIQSITHKDLIEWHKQWIRPGSSTLVVTGNAKLNDLLPALELAFKDWNGGKAPGKELTNVAATTGGRVYLIDQPDASQSNICAAHVSVIGMQADEVSIETVLRNFGGMSTSRLNRNLRLDKHWSYGVSGGLSSARGQRTFAINAPIQTDKTKEGIQELLKEIKGVAMDRPIAGEEYASIMQNMLFRLPARFSTLLSLDYAANGLINHGLPLDYWAGYASKVKQLTEKDLNEAAKKVVHPSEIIWVIVGDLKKIESGVRELNLGEVTVIDVEGKKLR